MSAARAESLEVGMDVVVNYPDGTTSSEGQVLGVLSDGWVRVGLDGGVVNEYPRESVEPW